MITTGSIYRDHEKIISRVKYYLKDKNISLTDCEDQAVYKRITQIVSKLTAEEYMLYVDTHGKTTNEKLTFKHCIINTETGECNIRFLQILISIYKFFVYWLYYLLVLFKSFFIKKDIESSITLLFDFVPNIEKNDRGFIEFCRNGKIKPLNEANIIISRVKKLPDSQDDPDIYKYTKRNPLEYALTNSLNGKQLTLLFIEHLLLPLYFVKCAFKSSFNLLLGQDIALLKIVKFLNKCSVIDAMITTTSGFESQPIWMHGLKNRNYKLHMLWYSQNFVPKIYKNEKETSNLPGAKLISVDEHWVWTNGFSKFLKNLQLSSNINVIGPIIWYLEDTNYVPKEALQIILFDVTPREGGNPYACLKNYYSVELMEKFVLDVVKICRTLSKKYTINISVILKRKRDVSPIHSKKYINFIDELVDEGEIILQDNNINIFSLIRDSLLSISVPYTSTAYISSFLKKTGIYYDPFAEISPNFEKSDYVQFASNYDDLNKFVESELTKLNYL